MAEGIQTPLCQIRQRPNKARDLQTNSPHYLHEQAVGKNSQLLTDVVLGENDILCAEQMSFSKGISIMDILMQLMAYIKNGFQKGHITSVSFAKIQLNDGMIILLGMLIWRNKFSANAFLLSLVRL